MASEEYVNRNDDVRIQDPTLDELMAYAEAQHIYETLEFRREYDELMENPDLTYMVLTPNVARYIRGERAFRLSTSVVPNKIYALDVAETIDQHLENGIAAAATAREEYEYTNEKAALEAEITPDDINRLGDIGLESYKKLSVEEQVWKLKVVQDRKEYLVEICGVFGKDDVFELTDDDIKILLEAGEVD